MINLKQPTERYVFLILQIPKRLWYSHFMIDVLISCKLYLFILIASSLFRRFLLFLTLRRILVILDLPRGIELGERLNLFAPFCLKALICQFFLGSNFLTFCMLKICCQVCNRLERACIIQVFEAKVNNKVALVFLQPIFLNSNITTSSILFLEHNFSFYFFSSTIYQRVTFSRILFMFISFPLSTVGHYRLSSLISS